MKLPWLYTSFLCLSITAFCLSILNGCSSNNQSSTSTPISGMPVGMQPSSSAPSSASTDSQLPGLIKKVALMESQLKKNPQNSSIKKQDAQANYDAGYAMMMSEKTNRKVRYRQALRYFRRTLLLNPQHADAAANKKLIEDIYRSMNLPIPQ